MNKTLIFFVDEPTIDCDEKVSYFTKEVAIMVDVFNNTNSIFILCS